MTVMMTYATIYTFHHSHCDNDSLNKTKKSADMYPTILKVKKTES